MNIAYSNKGLFDLKHKLKKFNFSIRFCISAEDESSTNENVMMDAWVYKER